MTASRKPLLLLFDVVPMSVAGGRNTRGCRQGQIERSRVARLLTADYRGAVLGEMKLDGPRRVAVVADRHASPLLAIG